MGLGVRFYLFADDGLQRISQRVMQGLAQGRDAMPQYAGTKQKVADVLVEMDKAKPVEVVRVECSYLTFDENGQVHRDLVASGFAAMEAFAALERAGKTQGKVVDLQPKLNRDKWERENRWTLTQAELSAISDDIWKRKKAASPKVTMAKGVAQTPPRMTWEAKAAIKEIQSKVWSIGAELERLVEPALKGASYEALRLAKTDQNALLWKAVSASADLRLEILKRHRSGAGVWYACVDILRWDITHHSGETTASFHERCNSKKEAEEAARRMLVENAQYLNAEHSIETSVVCELEWLDETDEAAK